MKAVKVKCKIWKIIDKNTDKNPLNAISIIFFCKLLVHRVFSADGHRGLIRGSLSNDDDDVEDNA